MLTGLRHFGRKLPLPSTRQILHEMRVFSAQEDAKRKLEAEQTVAPTPPIHSETESSKMR